MSLNPFDQFQVKKILDLSLFGYDISFTNSAMFMVIAISIICIFFIYVSRRVSIIPNKSQALAELIFEFTNNTLSEAAGESSKKFAPFIFALFSFIFILNVMGLLPFGFTVTSQLIITFALAIIVFSIVIVFGFAMHGLKFLSLFMPKGTPIFIAPLMIIIELFSFFVRPISLSIRLAGNMIAGHVLLKVLGTFVLLMGIAGLFPLSFMVIMIGFELFVAILQAYIFTMLTCIYLNDAINLH